MSVAALYPLALWGALFGEMVSPGVDAVEDPTAELTIVWDSPVGCSDEVDFRGRLRPLLARTSARGPARGDVEVRIRADGGERSSKWKMQLQITSGSGPWRREIDAPSCLQLVEVAALIAAITLDPLAASAALRVTSDGPSEAEDGPTSEPVGVHEANEADEAKTANEEKEKLNAGEERIEPETIEDEPDPLVEDVQPEAGERSPGSMFGEERRREPVAREGKTPRLGAALRAGLAGVYGPLPSFGLLLLGGVGLTIDRRAMIEVAVLHTFARRIPLADVSGIALEHRLTGARVSGCWLPSVRRLELPLCGGVDLAALRVEALGLNNSRPATDLYIGASATARLMWRPVARLAFGLELGGMVTLRGREYTIAGLEGPAAQTAPGGGHGGLNLEVRLP